MVTTRRIAIGMSLAGLAVGLFAFTAVLGRPMSRVTADVARDSTTPRLYEQHLAAVDHALARHDVSIAVRAWHDAYGVALFTPGWRPMIEVGDAFMRIGDVATARPGAKANARQAYLAALTRAARARDADGILAVVDAFARLGDQEVAKTCLRIAERVAAAGSDRDAIERVHAFSARWDERVVNVTTDLF